MAGVTDGQTLRDNLDLIIMFIDKLRTVQPAARWNNLNIIFLLLSNKRSLFYPSLPTRETLHQLYFIRMLRSILYNTNRLGGRQGGRQREKVRL